MKRARVSVLCLLTATLLVPALAGCRGVAFIRKGQAPPIFPADAADPIILRTAQARLGSVQTYRCDAADVVYRSPKESLAFDATIRLRAPDVARVIGEKLGAGTIFDLLAQGGIVRNYVPRDKKVYVYIAAERGARTMATVPWGLILGVRQYSPGSLPLRDAQIAREGTDIILKGLSEDGAFHQRLQFDAKTLLLKTNEITRIGGNSSIKAEYAEWTLIGDIWWPLHVFIHMPLPPEPKKKSAEATLEISQRVSKIKLNTAIPDVVFALDIPPGTPEEVVEPNDGN